MIFTQWHFDGVYVVEHIWNLDVSLCHVSKQLQAHHMAPYRRPVTDKTYWAPLGTGIVARESAVSSNRWVSYVFRLLSFFFSIRRDPRGPANGYFIFDKSNWNTKWLNYKGLWLLNMYVTRGKSWLVVGILAYKYLSPPRFRRTTNETLSRDDLVCTHTLTRETH
jgi:hypothetical protein